VSSDITPPPGKGFVVPVLMLAVIGIAIVALVWAMNWSPEPPTPPPESESPAKRAHRLAWALKEHSGNARKEAADELGKMGPEANDAVPQLIELLWSEDDDVRRAATQALDRIDKDWPKREEASAAVPHLIPRLWDQYEWRREAAARTLDRIDKDWPKRDEVRGAVTDLLDLLGEPVSDGAEVARILDRIDGHWRESEKAKTVAVKLIKQRYKTSWREYKQREIEIALERMNENWRESPEAKRAIGELIAELTAEANKFDDLSPPEGSPLWSAVERTALRALIDKLDTRSRAEFETAVAVLDCLDRHWPQYNEAKTVATKLTARLLTWDPPKVDKESPFTPSKGAIPPILAETLDRMDPNWAQSDNARKAVPVLVKRLRNPSFDDDSINYGFVAIAALLIRIDEESMEPVEERIIPRLVEIRGDTGYEVVVAIKTLGRIGKEPAVVVPRLVKWLQGPGRVALAAVEALGEFGNEADAAVPALLNLLERDIKDQGQLHQATLRALGRIGKQTAVVVPVLVDYLRSNRPDTSQDVRRAAAEALGGFGKDAAIAISKLLNGERIDPQYDFASAIEALGNIGPPAAPAVPFILRWGHGQFRRADDPERLFAIKALGQIKASPTTVVPDLEGNLESDVPERRQAAAEALGRFGGDAVKAVPSLLPLLLDEDGKTCRAALEALDRIDGKWPQSEAAKKLLPDLVKRLDHANADLRREAVRALGRFGKEAAPAVPKLVKLLDDPDPNVRRDATSSLVRIDDKWAQALDPARAVPLLRDVLTDRDPSVRKKAAETLGGFGKNSAGAIGGLVLLLADADEDVVKPAAEALGRIDGNWLQTEPARKAIPGLMKRLRDPLGAVRTNAAAALGRFGKDAAAAVTALVLCAADAVKDVRAAALVALGRIDEDWPRSAVAKKAVPQMERLRESDDAEVKNAAGSLLKKINP
jgi:HEAT repeat protein